ncbi:MAG: zf-HC2 domain-containing protein [Candidatus Wallbacteria bacterium]|nr:zf-HC2 domain-containing protein [Candidatus Wallbacteria bacterium]
MTSDPTGSGCEQMLELLSAGLDGALTFREREQVEAHAAVCESCRAEQARMSALEGELRRCEEPAPGELAANRARVLASLDREASRARGVAASRPRQGRRWWQMFLGGAWQPSMALALAVVLLAVVTVRRQGPAILPGAAGGVAAQAPSAESGLVLAGLPPPDEDGRAAAQSDREGVAMRLDAGAPGETTILWVMTNETK